MHLSPCVVKYAKIYDAASIKGRGPSEKIKAELRYFSYVRQCVSVCVLVCDSKSNLFIFISLFEIVSRISGSRYTTQTINYILAMRLRCQTLKRLCRPPSIRFYHLVCCTIICRVPVRNDGLRYRSTIIHFH